MRTLLTYSFAIVCASGFCETEEKFFFPADRRVRDPFTFAMAASEPAKEPIHSRGGIPSGATRILDELADRAEVALADRNIDQALKHCTEGFGILSALDVETLPAPIAVSRERLIRIHTAGARIRQREKVEALFSKQTLTVSGIVISDKRSHALINGSPAAAGQMVQTDEGEAVVVERIRDDDVLLRFRGYLFALPLQPATR